MIAEIIGPSGRVHYRRPPSDPLVQEALRTPGYSVRFVEAETVERAWDGSGAAKCRRNQRARAKPTLPALTKAERQALKWLRHRGGDGIFDNNGVALAAGENAPTVRSTWNRLRDFGYLEFYNPTGKGRGRLRLTARATEVVL